MITSEIATELRHNAQSREAQLTRTIIAIASALLAAMSLFTSAAEACISCEYVPSVVNSPSESHSEERSTPRREKRSTPRRENRTREVREPRENKKSRVTETAKSEKADKVQKTQKAEVEKAPAASTAQVENSSVALVTTAHESVPAKSETPGDRGMEHSAFAEKRVALVIGNGNYQNVPQLPNPTRDAEAIADLLRTRAGFEVVQVHNDLRAQDFMLALRAFKKVADDADIALVFYAGHAIQLRETNYMVAVDATLDDEADAQNWNQAIPLDLILGAARAKRLGVVILDACRDNPFIRKMRTRGVLPTKAGLAPTALIEDEGANGDTLIVYATAAGLVAADGDGEHSPFTEALLKHLAEPGLDVMRMFGRVRDEVRQNTGSAQIPYTYGTLGGDEIALVPAPAKTDAPGVTGQEDELLVQKVLRQFREESAKGKTAEQALKAAEAQRKADAEQTAEAKRKAAAEAVPPRRP
jgi:uncharacterized caspase-like protein